MRREREGRGEGRKRGGREQEIGEEEMREEVEDGGDNRDRWRKKRGKYGN